MSETILGEIKMFAGNIEPTGWMFCDGRLLAIRDHLALFSILGNTYGGDGRNTFGLPDLRGRVPMGKGAGPGLTNRRLGEEPGAEAVILDVTQMPAHDHTLRATNSAATQTQPAGNVLARASTPQYLNASTSVVMGTDSIGPSGSNAPHANVQPSSVLSFIIAVEGEYPRRLPAGF
jgi:microcystin-dependent protein